MQQNKTQTTQTRKFHFKIMDGCKRAFSTKVAQLSTKYLFIKHIIAGGKTKSNYNLLCEGSAPIYTRIQEMIPRKLLNNFIASFRQVKRGGDMPPLEF